MAPKQKYKINKKHSGFTIVELIVVISVIGILAAIAYVGYGGMQDRAREGLLRSDLTSAAELLNLDKVRSGSFPVSLGEADKGNGLPASKDTNYQYTLDASASPPTFCLTGINGTVALFITDQGRVQEGVCPGHTSQIADGDGSATVADAMQDITSATCPASRTRVFDARDNRSYWIKILPDGKCWMMTDLAYAGGGANIHGDVKTLMNGTNDTASSYTSPKYYIPSGASPTEEPNNPSTSTDGSGQYGYLYNWCGVMGGQTNRACSNSSTPVHDANISICPAGWRIPSSSELQQMSIAVNGGSSATASSLRLNWLAQHAGDWGNGSFGQGDYGFYWTSSFMSANSSSALYFDEWWAGVGGMSKHSGFPARCIAS